MSFSAFAEEGPCYIAESDGTKTYYSSLDGAIASGKGKEIFVTADTSVCASATTLSGGEYTVTGIGSPTVTQSNRIIVTDDARLILNNITFDLKDNTYIGLEGGIMDLNSAKVLNGLGDWGTVAIGDWARAGILNISGESEISGKSKYDAAGHGSVITVHSNCTSGTINMTGGKIINKDSSSGHCPIYAMTANAKINISGNASIDKGTGANNAIGLTAADTLVLAGDFTGDISVKYGALGDYFGTVKDGATLSGIITHAEKGSQATVKDGKLYWYYEAYLGTDEAANRYEKLTDAVKKNSKGTIGLSCDAVWKGYDLSDAGGYGMHHKTLTVAGNGHTLKLTDEFYVGLDSCFTLENIDVDLKDNRILIGCNGSLTLGSGATVKNAAGSTPISIEKRNGSDGGTFTMLKGSLITDCKTDVSAIVRVWHGGKAVISGEITGNNSSYGAIKLDSEAGTLTLKDSAVVFDNFGMDSESEYNIVPLNGSQITFEAGFSGKAGITCSGEGEAFALAGENLTSLPDIGTVVNDGNPTLFGWINGGSLIWQKAPQLSAETDCGTYENGTKAIVRFLISFDEAPVDAYITSYGAYIISGEDFDGDEMKKSESKFVKENQEVLASGKGYIVDIHTKNLERAYPVAAFCFIKNIDAPVYMVKTAPAVNSRENVKELSDETVKGYESSYEN